MGRFEGALGFHGFQSTGKFWTGGKEELPGEVWGRHSVLRRIQIGCVLLRGFGALLKSETAEKNVGRKGSDGQDGGCLGSRPGRRNGSRSVGFGNCISEWSKGLQRTRIARKSSGRAGKDIQSGANGEGGSDSGKIMGSGRFEDCGRSNSKGRASKVNSGDVGKRSASSECTQTKRGPTIEFEREDGISAGDGHSNFQAGGFEVGLERERFTSSEIGVISAMGSTTTVILNTGTIDTLSSRLSPLKGVAKSIKLASNVMGSVKSASLIIGTFQSPASGILMGFGPANGVVVGFEAAKLIISGAKISKNVVQAWKVSRATQSRATTATAQWKGAIYNKLFNDNFTKGLKVSDGALSAVKVARVLAKGVDNISGEMLYWGIVTKGYEVSKGALTVVDAFISVKGGMIGIVGNGFTELKKGMGGIGVMVKAFVLSRQIFLLAINGVGISKGALEMLNLLSAADKRTAKLSQFTEAIKDTELKSAARDPGTIAVTAVHSKMGFKSRQSDVKPIVSDRGFQVPGVALTSSVSYSGMYTLASVLLSNSQNSLHNSDKDSLDCTSRVLPYHLFSLAIPH